MLDCVKMSCCVSNKRRNLNGMSDVMEDVADEGLHMAMTS